MGRTAGTDRILRGPVGLPPEVPAPERFEHSIGSGSETTRGYECVSADREGA